MFPQTSGPFRVRYLSALSRGSHPACTRTRVAGVVTPARTVEVFKEDYRLPNLLYESMDLGRDISSMSFSMSTLSSPAQHPNYVVSSFISFQAASLCKHEKYLMHMDPLPTFVSIMPKIRSYSRLMNLALQIKFPSFQYRICLEL